MSSLKISNLKKKIKGRYIVNDVSLTIPKNNIIGLLGPNGAGKTTCFYIIAGLIYTDKGSIHLNHHDITFQAIHKRAEAGLVYLPQDASIFRKMTVVDNILSILERQKLSHKERQNKLHSLLHEFNITHLADALGMHLSGGERRRVEIARALAMKPSFILLDEPFAGIDPISVCDIKNIIIHLKEKGLGVLLTDHNVRESLDICNYAYIMSEGRIIASGESHMIMQDKNVRDVYLGEAFSI